jgi:hypothetical protein
MQKSFQAWSPHSVRHVRLLTNLVVANLAAVSRLLAPSAAVVSNPAVQPEPKKISPKIARVKFLWWFWACLLLFCK